MKKYTYGYTMTRGDQGFGDYNLTFKEALKQLHRASDEIKYLTCDEARKYRAFYGNEIKFTLDRYTGFTDEECIDFDTIESLKHYSYKYVYSKSKEKYIKKPLD